MSAAELRSRAFETKLAAALSGSTLIHDVHLNSNSETIVPFNADGVSYGFYVSQREIPVDHLSVNPLGGHEGDSERPMDGSGPNEISHYPNRTEDGGVYWGKES
jgi:hypothetical protein